MDRYFILNKIKSWVAGLAGALSVAAIHWFEKESGIDLDDTWDLTVSAAVTGFILQQLVYWIPNRERPVNPGAVVSNLLDNRSANDMVEDATTIQWWHIVAGIIVGAMLGLVAGAWAFQP